MFNLRDLWGYRVSALVTRSGGADKLLLSGVVPANQTEKMPIREPVREKGVCVPKGPFRTKNTTTIVKIVNYYAVVILLRPPNLLRCGPFFERKNVCNSQENGVRARCAAIVNHPAVLKILRVVHLLRVVFSVQRGICKRLSGPMRDTPPPHIAQYSFEIVSQRGYRTHLPCFHRVSRKYR